MDWGAWWARVRGSQSQTRLSDGGHIHTDVCHSFPSKEQASLISWLQSLSTVILEPKKIVCHCFQFFPLHFPWSDATRCHDLSFLMLSFKPAFHSPSSRGSLVPLHFLPWEWYPLLIWGCYFSRQCWFQLEIHPFWHFTWCTLPTGYISRMTTYSLVVLLSQFGPVCCSMSGSNCCFLMHI